MFHNLSASDMQHRLIVNGGECVLTLAPGTPLLDALRGPLALTGAKEACGRGECGACTVLIDGRTVMSCITLVEDVRGPVTTVEGLAADNLDLREAFADCGAFQCGFCTPGQIVSAAALLCKDWPSDPQAIRNFVRANMSGNLCRCTGYAGIVDAVIQTAVRRGKITVAA